MAIGEFQVTLRRSADENLPAVAEAASFSSDAGSIAHGKLSSAARLNAHGESKAESSMTRRAISECNAGHVAARPLNHRARFCNRRLQKFEFRISFCDCRRVTLGRLAFSTCILVMVSVTTICSVSQGDDIHFERGESQLKILVGDKHFATYVFRDPKISRPYFAHVHAPNGVQVTRNHPPQPGDAQDHGDYHPGLWMAFGDVDGHDYWRLKARVVHERIDALVTTEPNHGWFVVQNKYLSTDGQRVVCQERCRFDIYANTVGYLLVWDSQFSVAEKDFYFGDQEEMGLGVRVATPIAVDRQQGGQIVDSQGRHNGKEVWGKQADWCDYHGPVNGHKGDGHKVGVMIMPDPENFRASWWHARDYGFVAANPFGVNAFTDGAKSRVYVRKDKPLRLRYGVLIHDDNVATDAQRQSAYRDFCEVVSDKSERASY